MHVPAGGGAACLHVLMLSALACSRCRVGLNRTGAGSEYTWWDGTGVGQTVASGEAYPHWAWPQPQLAAKAGHDCVAAWSGYRYERFAGNADNAAQVGAICIPNQMVL
jgi:hypothetical protein